MEDVEVPVENRIGEEGYGAKIAMLAINGGRVNVGGYTALKRETVSQGFELQPRAHWALLTAALKRVANIWKIVNNLGQN